MLKSLKAMILIIWTAAKRDAQIKRWHEEDGK
ncbi:hypothetical protein N399_07075 [Bacillus licheniformis CG-B52]|nr:hypothetical protein MUY_001387 [Bacillus licheniformis WX-02]EQM28765.1 hypothetical protein N399_07075 [Bacillus licheniformis CG-B52]KUL07168.1 hypothetical protein LI17339_20100 [Bacillus licheniformis LMG 17339]